MFCHDNNVEVIPLEIAIQIISKNWYDCKLTWDIILFYTKVHIIVKEQRF